MIAARRWAWSVLGLLGCGASAWAGVVVLKNGNVIVGEIQPQDVTAEAIRVQQPEGAAGSISIPRDRVRWFDLEADQPTDDYWERFPDAALDGVWIYTCPTAPEPEVEIPNPPPLFSARQELNALPTGDRYLELRGPQGWEVLRERGVTMLVSDHAGSGGFRPRIHVFSVEAAQGSYSEQVSWIADELARMADADGYEVDQLYRLRQVDGGADQRLVTVSRVGQRRVRALRQVFFRQGRTYFFAAYADDRDYDRLKGLFRRVLETMRLLQP